MTMNDQFFGKRLLILGSNFETIPLIQRANDLGICTYVADYDSNSPGKAVATVPVNIDGKDINSLATLCLRESIDGILVGVADRLIEPYAELCSRLSLPCYASIENCRLLTNKVHFNDLLRKFQLPVIESVTVHDTGITHSDLPDFPLLVKPADGNSGKGLTRCNQLHELEPAITKALSMSASQTALVERYMECDDLFVYLSVVNGIISVCAIADRHTVAINGELGRVCVAAHYPSKYLTLFSTKYEEKFRRLIRSLGIQYGVLMVSGFVSHGEIHFYDPGFRLQGEAPDVHVVNHFGISHVDMLLEFALYGAVSNYERYLPPYPCYARHGHGMTLWLLCNPGIVHSIINFDSTKSDACIFATRQRFFSGDTISASMSGTEGQVFARAYMRSDTLSQVISAAQSIQKKIKVLDEGDHNLIEPVDIESLF